MKISKTRFMNYLKVQESGERNMVNYDTLIQKRDNWAKCHKHFVEDKQEDDLEVENES